MNTTTKLRLTIRDQWRLHERHIRDGAIGGIFVTTVLLIHALLQPAPEPMPPIAQQQAPAILIATAQPLPTLTPQPTAEPVVVEVPVYQEPVYVPVEVPVYVEVYTPPTMPPLEPASITEEKPADDRAAHYAAATSGHGSKVRDR